MPKMSARRSTVIGAVSGLGVAVIIVLLAWLNEGADGSETLRQIINFSASLPTLFVTQIDMPYLLQNILFFIYWALVGGVLGWLIGQRHLLLKMVSLLVVTGLIISHRLAQVKLERELEEIVNALGEMLKTLIGGGIQ